MCLRGEFFDTNDLYDTYELMLCCLERIYQSLTVYEYTVTDAMLHEVRGSVQLVISTTIISMVDRCPDCYWTLFDS